MSTKILHEMTCDKCGDSRNFTITNEGYQENWDGWVKFEVRLGKGRAAKRDACTLACAAALLEEVLDERDGT